MWARGTRPCQGRLRKRCLWDTEIVPAGRRRDKHLRRQEVLNRARRFWYWKKASTRGGTLPVAACALHGGARFHTGMVGTRPGPILASADAIEAVVHGRRARFGVARPSARGSTRSLTSCGRCPDSRDRTGVAGSREAPGSLRPVVRHKAGPGVTPGTLPIEGDLRSPETSRTRRPCLQAQEGCPCPVHETGATPEGKACWHLQGKCPSTRPPDWCKVDPLAAPSLLEDAAKRTRT